MYTVLEHNYHRVNVCGWLARSISLSLLPFQKAQRRDDGGSVCRLLVDDERVPLPLLCDIYLCDYPSFERKRDRRLFVEVVAEIKVIGVATTGHYNHHQVSSR